MKERINKDTFIVLHLLANLDIKSRTFDYLETKIIKIKLKGLLEILYAKQIIGFDRDRRGKKHYFIKNPYKNHINDYFELEN